MIYRWKQSARWSGDYAEEYDLATQGGVPVATVGWCWNLSSYEVIDTPWEYVPEKLKGLFANMPSLETAILRFRRDNPGYTETT